MGERFARLKDENKILIMLAFFSIAKGLWENFRQLWLQDNNFNVSEISQILSIASLFCVILLIVFSRKLALNRIKKILCFSIFTKAVCLLLLYILNHSQYISLINILVILDTIFEKVVSVTIYPFIVTIKKDDRLYSKRKLVEYLFCDVGILVGGIFIGKTIGSILINYNICLLISIIFLFCSFIIILNIKSHLVNEKTIKLKDGINYILKNRISKCYMFYILIGNVAMSTGLGLKMLMLTNIFNFTDGIATNYLLLVGLIADLLGIIALKVLNFKNDYISITIKFGIRFALYMLAFITNSMIICFIAMTWSILITTAYENVIDAPYINRIKNEYQMVFTNIRYIIKLIGTSIGLYFAGLTYNMGIKYMLGLSAFFMIFQLVAAYYLRYLRTQEAKKIEEIKEKNKIINLAT